MSIAEMFLMGWAVIMTVGFFYVRSRAISLIKEKRALVELVGEICLGDVKPEITHNGNGFIVDTDTIKLGGVRKSYVGE